MCGLDRDEGYLQDFSRQTSQKKLLWRLRKWEDNIKTEVTKTGCRDWKSINWLRTVSNGELSYYQSWTIGFWELDAGYLAPSKRKLNDSGYLPSHAYIFLYYEYDDYIYLIWDELWLMVNFFNIPHHIPRAHPQCPDGRRPVLFPEYQLQCIVPQLQAALLHSVVLARMLHIAKISHLLSCSSNICGKVFITSRLHVCINLTNSVHLTKEEDTTTYTYWIMMSQNHKGWSSAYEFILGVSEII
jgi:hypothetical protein